MSASEEDVQSALSTLSNPPASAEGKQYAGQIVKRALSGEPQAGEQSLFADLQANAESARQMLRDARTRLLQQQIPPQETSLQQAAAWFAPSKTGLFSENIGRALSTAAEQAKAQREFQATQQGQALGLSEKMQDVDTNLLNARLKLQELHEQQANAAVPAALRVLAAPGKSPETGMSPIGKMVVDRLGPNALQTPEGQALFDKLVAQKSPDVQGNIGQQDIDLLGDRYFETGVMPSMGMGKEATALRQQIVHSATLRATGKRSAVADTSGQGASAAMTGNAATSKAAGSMLTDMTKRTAVADASEQTAGTNLDLAYGLMTKADQAGSPLINAIQNKIRAGIMGDPDVSAYVNALTTASNEYARVVSMATGAQGITDAARKEGHDLFNPTLAPEQLKHNIEVARKEMANRTASLHEQITNAKRGLYKGPTPETSTPSQTGKTGLPSIDEINAELARRGVK